MYKVFVREQVLCKGAIAGTCPVETRMETRVIATGLTFQEAKVVRSQNKGSEISPE